MPSSGKRARDTAESQMLSIVRRTLVNPEKPGIPIILFKADNFLVIYNQELMFLQDIDFNTITMFRDDICGSHETTADVSNLSSFELVELVTVLNVFVDSRKGMQEAEERAAQRIRGRLAQL